MFAKVIDGEVLLYPYTDKDIRKEYPNTSFPVIMSDELMEEFGAVKVELQPRPSIDDRTQYLRSGPLEYVNNVWTQGWIIENINPEQLASGLRGERNRKLQMSDWTQGKDIPDEISTPWALYRDALRRLPEQEGFPQTVIWPVEPEL